MRLRPVALAVSLLGLLPSIVTGASGYPPPSCDCQNCVPAVSTWGVIILCLVLLATAKALSPSLRRRASAQVAFRADTR